MMIGKAISMQRLYRTVAFFVAFSLVLAVAMGVLDDAEWTRRTWAAIGMATIASAFFGVVFELFIARAGESDDDMHRLLDAFEHSTNGIIITDLRGKITKVNAAFVRLFGYAPEECIGESTRILRSTRTSNEFYQEMWRDLSERGEWKGEIINRCKDGSEIPVFLTITPIFSPVGIKIGFLGVEIDLRDRKRQEEERLTLLNAFQRSTNGIIITDLDDRIVDTNATFSRIFGWRREDVLGRRPQDFLPAPAVSPDVIAGIERAYRASGEWQGEIANVTRDGREVPVYLGISAIINERGQQTGRLRIQIDLTEVKRLEEELRHRERLSAIGEMAAILAHEIRTPLTAMKMNADILSRMLKLDDDEREYLDILRKEVKRLENLVNDILSFARPGTLRLADCEPAALLDDVQRIVASDCAERNVRLSVEIDGPIPRVACDSDKMKQVLINIVRNSIEAMAEGGLIGIKVSVDSIGDRSSLRILVRDTGPGIPSTILPEIFTPFRTTKPSGSGLGLPICRRIVEEHQGTIDVQSTVGRGTSVIIHLPLAGAAHVETEAA